MRADDACSLVLEACHLIERHRGTRAPGADVLDEIAHVRAALAVAGACDDDAVAGDVDCVRAELRALEAELTRPADVLHSHAA